jgi:diguanylate cyclase (GGDEF)-like protein
MSNDRQDPALSAGQAKPSLSIRARLFVLAAIILAPMMFDRVRTMEADRAERTAAAHQQVLGLVRQGIDAQRETLISTRAFLQVAARAHATVATGRAACDRFLSDMAAQVSWIKTFSVASPDGHIVCSSAPQAIGLEISDRHYFQEAMRTGQYVLSDYAVGRLNATPMIVALFPQRGADGTVEAVLVGVLDSVWVGRLANATAGHANAALMMVNGTGAVLTHHPDPGDWTGREFKDHPLVRAMLARPEGTVSENGLDGIRRVFGFVQLPGMETRLAIGLDEREILSRVDREMLHAYLQLALIAAVLALAIWVGGYRLIVRPIRLLAAMAERFGRDEYEMRGTRRRWAAEFIPLVVALDEMAAKIVARRDEARVLAERLSALATTDELSRLANRRAFDAALKTEWERARTRGEHVALAMVDADHFKAFNDHYGHVHGDACLRSLGEILAMAVRTDLDLAARYGGEEFALLLPGVDIHVAEEVAQRLRKVVEQRDLRHETAPLGRVTVSIGVASLRPAAGQSAQALVEAADAALYAAKRHGRNTVVAHETMKLLATG